MLYCMGWREKSTQDMNKDTFSLWVRSLWLRHKPALLCVERSPPGDDPRTVPGEKTTIAQNAQKICTLNQ